MSNYEEYNPFCECGWCAEYPECHIVVNPDCPHIKWGFKCSNCNSEKITKDYYMISECGNAVCIKCWYGLHKYMMNKEERLDIKVKLNKKYGKTIFKTEP